MNATQIETDASLWMEDSTRPAGFRQTLKIGDWEYGFCWIPAGEFDMGSPESEEGRSADETLYFDDETLHHVKLTRGFWMLETPTPGALYKEFMVSDPRIFDDPSFVEEYSFPENNVSWDDATQFCAELTERLPKGLKASLPTEAQWEHACRAGTKTAYWYGDRADSHYMNYYNEGVQIADDTRNPWGLYDMHGNVGEWCLDYADDYPTGSVTDPKGPNSGSYRVVRGGSAFSSAELCRSASRDWTSADSRRFNVGFRFLLSCD